MLCKGVQLSSQRDRPEADGVCFHRGNPLTYFYIFGGLRLKMGLLREMYAIFFLLMHIKYAMIHFQNHSGVSAKCRNTRVEELWGLTSFFGYSTQTFVQAVNLLDRFLAIMKV